MCLSKKPTKILRQGSLIARSTTCGRFPEFDTHDRALEERIQEQMAKEIAAHAAYQLMKEGRVRSRAASYSSGASVEVARSTLTLSEVPISQ